MRLYSTHACAVSAAGYNPYLVAARLKELEDEAASQRLGLSQPYCEVIMKHSSYKKPQKDRCAAAAAAAAYLAGLTSCVDI
jgi:hypothetical protein